MAKILEISEIFLMADLKAQVENLAIKMINKANVKELCEKAEKFGCTNLLEACVQLMVKERVSLDKEETANMPDATAACLEAFNKDNVVPNMNLPSVLEHVIYMESAF